MTAGVVPRMTQATLENVQLTLGFLTQKRRGMILHRAGALLEKRTDNSWFFNASGGAGGLLNGRKSYL